MTGALSIGVAGGLGPAVVARLAAAVEAAGFWSLWVNDTPEGDSLAVLRAAADTTTRLRLATGVLPVDRRPAADIAAAAADLPTDRLVLGIGSGAARTGQLALVEQAVATLRERTRATVMVGALGPRMRRLAATRADGPLLSWLTPADAAEQADEAHEVGGAETRVALYVRTTLDPAAEPRLAEETARYASFGNYAANFARLGVDPHDTVVRPEGAADRVAAYREAVDEVVLRAITPDDLPTSYERFVESAGRTFFTR